MSDTPKAAQSVEGFVKVRAVYSRRKFHDDGSSELVPVAELPEEEQVILTREYPPNVEVGRVAVARGMKINMGNYESAEVWTSVTLPALFEETGDAFAEAEKQVIAQLTPAYKKLIQKSKAKEQEKSTQANGGKW